MTFQVTGMTGDTYNTKDFMKVISLFYFSPSGTKANRHTSPDCHSGSGETLLASDKKLTTLTIIFIFSRPPSSESILNPKDNKLCCISYSG
jgi:hypothetical protein